MKVTLIQANPHVGALKKIRAKMLQDIHIANEEGSDVIVFPELATTGYPPRDLLYKPGFVEYQLETAHVIHEFTLGMNLTSIFGYVSMSKENTGHPIQNSVAIIQNGTFQSRSKVLLPNYDVFDEVRYFAPGNTDVEDFPLFKIKDKWCGAVICEEMWAKRTTRPLLTRSPEYKMVADAMQGQKLYDFDPVWYYKSIGAQAIFCVNASPFRANVMFRRYEMVAEHGIEMHCCFQVGGNDEIVFDGSSFGMNADGKMFVSGDDIYRNSFHEAKVSYDTISYFFNVPDQSSYNICDQRTDAAVTGLKDYATKQGIKRLLINMSGGIDSAYAGYIAKKTGLPLMAFTQPSEFSSNETLSDAALVCKNLGIPMGTIPIRRLHQMFRDYLNESITGMVEGYGGGLMTSMGLPYDANGIPVLFEDSGMPDENLQPRIRALNLMAWANLLNALVVGTGNRSEMSVGYCTMYGDMAAGLNVLKDIPKTAVFSCCRRANEIEGREIIPVSIIDRPPSAELRKDQKDTDSLPPYAVLDEIEQRYTSDQEDVHSIIIGLQEGPTIWLTPEIERADLAAGVWNETQLLAYRRAIEEAVITVCTKIDNSEYKRRQSPLGIKTTDRDLARGRQVPVVQGWTQQWLEELRNRKL